MKNIIKALHKYRSFLITTHENPDPDALCSQLALAQYLRAQKKKVLLLNEEALPEQFGFLPDTKGIRTYQKDKRYVFDAALIVDCGELSRVGKVKDTIKKHHVIVNIDHHVTNDKFGHVNYVDPKASSTAEIIYEMLKKDGFSLTKKVAELLYIGILTDTGSFRYENTTSRTHQIAGELLQYGVSVVKLYRQLYERVPAKDIKGFSELIARFKTYQHGRVVTIELTKNVLMKFSKDFDLKDMIFKFLRSIQGVEVIIIFTEIHKKRTRINLRSTQFFNVAKLAHHFNGGGHKRASGCQIEAELSAAKKKILYKIAKT